MLPPARCNSAPIGVGMLAIISVSTGAIAPRSADTIARSISVSVIGSKLCVATDFATSQEFFFWGERNFISHKCTK